MSGVKHLRLAKGDPILQDGPKASSIIQPNPQTDISGYWHEHRQTKTGGDVKAPKKNTPYTGYEKNTAPPKGRALPSRGEGPAQTTWS